MTLLFTDMVGSTELSQRLGDDEAEQVRREHFRVLSQAVADAGGREVKSTGDGVMAAFGSALDAVACAVAIQKGIGGIDSLSGDASAVRVGLNAGEAIEERGDFHGTPVNVAARLCQAAKGGQIVASDLVRGLVGNRGGQRFRSLGRLELRGLDAAVLAWEVIWREGEVGADLQASKRSVLDAEALKRMPLPRALVETARNPFVGRAENLAALERVWGETAHAQRLALVAGEPGIGKTRLCAEFCGRVYEAGAVVLYGRSDEEIVLPYQPFVELLSTLLAGLDDEVLAGLIGTTGPDLVRLVPDLEHRLAAVQAPRVLDAETERYRLFEAVAEVLAQVTAAAPVVLVLDDLHWTDRPSLLLLRHLARSPRLTRLMILGTYRETDLERRHPFSEALADLRRDQSYDRVLLRGLSAGEVREFMEGSAGHAFSGRGLSIPDVIHRETEGNPFFIGEVVRHMVETGKFFQRDGVWVFAEPVTDLGIPEGVRDVITRRLSRLSDDCNKVLAQASVLGREFQFDVLAAMVGSEDEALAAIEETVEHSLLVESTSERRSPSYAFTHSLVRQCLYEEISLPRKQKLHLRAAEAIESTHHRELRPVVAALAVHYRNAGAAANPELAIDYSIQAGRAAYSSAAYEEAVIHLEAALQLIEEEETLKDRRGEVQELLGDVMYITGTNRARANKYLEDALVVYQSEERLDRVIQVQSKLGRNYSTIPEAMDIPRAREHFRAAEAMVSGLPDSVPIGYLQLGIGAAALWGVRIEEGMAAANRALAIAEATGNDALWANAASIKGYFLGEQGRPLEGLELLDAAWQLANRINHVTAAFFSAWIGGGVAWFIHDVRAAADRLRLEMATERSRQNPDQRSLLLDSLMLNLCQRGELDEARGLESELPPASAGPYFSRSWLAYADGDWERAGSIAIDALNRSTACGDNTSSWAALWYLGYARIAEGDLDSARATLEQGLALSVQRGSAHEKIWFVPTLGRLCLDAGEVDRTRELIELLRSAFTTLDGVGSVASRLDELEAEIAVADGDEARGRELFAASISVYREYPDVWSEAEYRIRWASRLRGLDDRDGADEQIEGARQVYERIGAGRPWVDRLERLSGR